MIREIERQVQKNPLLNGIFRTELFLTTGRLLTQERGQRSSKVYSIYAPEVECIDKDKAHKPCEFGDAGGGIARRAIRAGGQGVPG